ncbi:flagellar export chaperone FliS [Lysinibacillus macroides]|uniref:Flagellar biosynthesis protein FliS n=1 Tax=Lysinibacillus macroides TaxID=33935 RepID=A0A0M9DL42_9BACI|nr:flagellar export chaperone FliS [Lysinibacillus macroides]KOY82382.1 flagellar biosynthesis protein FliS [Lysinibacillus macroides]QPR66577.1 flagellar export chaperone FliS [Lysinibacillus macroides]
MPTNVETQHTGNQNHVATASPGELTLMLYEGCLKFLHQARVAIQDENRQGKDANIQKAQAIIHELMTTLNMDYDMSKNMFALYEYMNHRLLEVHMQDDLVILEEVEGLIREFHDTWKKVI